MRIKMDDQQKTVKLIQKKKSKLNSKQAEKKEIKIKEEIKRERKISEINASSLRTIKLINLQARLIK